MQRHRAVADYVSAHTDIGMAHRPNRPISEMTKLAVLEATAKGNALRTLNDAVLTPTILTAGRHKGPPELPGLALHPSG